MSSIKIARSFIAADSIAELVAADYDVGAVGSKLFSKMLRTQDNDHYLVTTADGEKYVARVYQFSDRLERQESDYLYELDWLHFLHQQQMPVSYPIRRREGGFLGAVQATEGRRYYALFSLAAGKPLNLNDEEQLYIMGQEMARIHLASNKYENNHARQQLDLEFLVDRPVARIQKFWDTDEARADKLEILMISAAEAKAEILDLINNEEYTPDGWGPIGGDFHKASVFFDAQNRPTFFNFDWCGYGWRAYDIAVFLFNTNLIHESSADKSEAFFAGYFSQRQLSNNEHRAIAPFITLRRIWQTGLFTMNDGMVGHSFIAPANI